MSAGLLVEDPYVPALWLVEKLFGEGRDTAEIAAMLKTTEAVVYNLLAGRRRA